MRAGSPQCRPYRRNGRAHRRRPGSRRRLLRRSYIVSTTPCSSSRAVERGGTRRSAHQLRQAGERVELALQRHQHSTAAGRRRIVNRFKDGWQSISTSSVGGDARRSRAPARSGGVVWPRPSSSTAWRGQETTHRRSRGTALANVAASSPCLRPAADRSSSWLHPRRHPASVVALPCGSRLSTNTLRPVAAGAVARLTAVVVLPTPPF